jgi:hypothetical protein
MVRAFTAHNAWAAGIAAGLSLLLVGCGIGIQRDLSTMKASEVVYDDACGLQEYFDALKSPQVSPPSETFSQDFSQEGPDKGVGGKTRFLFSSDFQMFYVKRMLTQNWKRLPPEVANAPSMELEVRWAQKAGVKRVVTTDDARVMVGAKSWYLPYHVCLSDMLFGEELYDTRRVFLQLPPPRPNPFIKGKDAGIVTPAMARADVVGTQEIADATAETGDGAVVTPPRPPMMGAMPEIPAVVVKPGAGTQKAPKVADAGGAPQAQPESQKLARPEGKGGERAVPAASPDDQN